MEPAAAQSASERSNTAASAGASALGRALCDPPPPFPNGKPQPAGVPFAEPDLRLCLMHADTACQPKHILSEPHESRMHVKVVDRWVQVIQ